jgi:hypothetical protein
MAQEYMTTPEAATLSQSELFTRFLEAKLRVNAMQSTLIEDPAPPAATAEEWFLSWHGCESACLAYDFPDQILDDLRVCDEPEWELERAVDDLERLLDGIKFLHREFRAVCEQTRTEPPDDDAPEDAHREWEQNPGYVLPVIAQKEAA